MQTTFQTGSYKKYDDEFENSSKIQLRLNRVFDFLTSLDKAKITDTIFKRQPIFFSLFIVLDTLKSWSKIRVERAINEIDVRFNSEENKEPSDIEFYNACTSTTQRISQRRIGDSYIHQFM
jgi:hypothetical protein